MKNYNITPILDEQEFKEYKKFQLPIIDKYQYFNEKKTHEIIDCGRMLWFGLYRNKEDSSETKKLENMFTCKDRFCPFCNWRRARKLAIQSYDILKAIEADIPTRNNFGTFTVKNCRIEHLSDTIKHMNKAWQRMAQTKRFRTSVLGWCRILEYPPQKTDNNMMHPHFHCLIVVPPDYFDTKKDLYIPQREWQLMWKKALGVDYMPSVDIRIIKSRSGDPIAKAVAEFAKYPLKSIDLESMTVDQFQELTMQMKHKRAIAFGGIVKEYRKKLQLDDVEDGDLIYDSLDNKEIWEKVAELVYQYEQGKFGLDYYMKDMRILQNEI